MPVGVSVFLLAKEEKLLYDKNVLAYRYCSESYSHC